LPSTISGERIYAIGDVHGRLDLLQKMLDRIGAHSDERPAPRALHLVFLGDLVDRGPDSAGVLALVHDLQRRNGQVLALMGNHEEAMVQALDGDEDMLRTWLAVGGMETLASFDVAPPQPGEPSRAFLRRARRAIPAPWLSWLAGLPLSAESGDYFFAHAGVRPGIPLHRQARRDLLWIREDFLEDPRDHGAVVVHGHSVTRTADRRANRIGIDTGAYRSGTLTAIYLEDDRQEILSVSAAPAPFRDGAARR